MNSISFKNALMLWAFCLLSLGGCSQTAQPELSQADSSQTEQAQSQAEPEPVVMLPEVHSLKDRLEAITAEVERTQKYSLSRPARFAADEKSPNEITAVEMYAAVYSSGDLDYPAVPTPVQDDDLLLLLPFAKTLKHLHLPQTTVTDAGLETISRLTSLEFLDLSGVNLAGQGVIHLAKLPELKQLVLSETKMSPENVEALGELKSLETIRFTSEMVDEPFLSAIGRITSLKRLGFYDKGISDEGLASLVNLQQLDELSLNSTKITGTGLVHLVGLQNLRKLNLSYARELSPDGMAALGQLTQIQELNLRATHFADDDLKHLSGLNGLMKLDLTFTKVRGPGLAYLKSCQHLQEILLPPVSINAAPALNQVKSLQRLQLTVTPAETRAVSTEEQARLPDSIHFREMPKLTSLSIQTYVPVKSVQLEDLPRLTSLQVFHKESEYSRPDLLLPETSLRGERLPSLTSLKLAGSFSELTGNAFLENLKEVSIRLNMTTSMLRVLNRCDSLVSLRLELDNLGGDPIPGEELREMPQMQTAHLVLSTSDQSWLSELVAKMPMLKQLTFSGYDLKGERLASFANCTRMEQIVLAGIDDEGEPLTFLKAMPHLKQLSLAHCPKVGKIRLNQEGFVQELVFVSGRLDELEIQSASRLEKVHLGYGDHSFRLDRAGRRDGVDLGRLVVSDSSSLKSLMVNAGRSKISLREVEIANLPKLRDLLIIGHWKNQDPVRTHLTVQGEFPDIVRRRIWGVTTDGASYTLLKSLSGVSKESNLDAAIFEKAVKTSTSE